MNIDTPPLKNRFIAAKVINVYDGDTVTVVYLIGKEPFKINIRVKDIDSPEIRTKNKIEKMAGYKCRDYVSSLISDKIVMLYIHNWDKYGGRIVGDIYLNSEETLSERLLNMKLVNLYDGKTKKKKWKKRELCKYYDL